MIKARKDCILGYLPLPSSTWGGDRLPDHNLLEDMLCGSYCHFLLWLSPKWRRGWRD